jgi:hypothetical protein
MQEDGFRRDAVTLNCTPCCDPRQKTFSPRRLFITIAAYPK